MPAILYIFGILATTYVSTVVVNKLQGDDPDYPGKGTDWDAWPEEEESGEILDDIKNFGPIPYTTIDEWAIAIIGVGAVVKVVDSISRVLAK